MSSCTLNTSTRAAGSRLTIRRVVSTPLTPGSVRSITTTSGAVSAKRRYAASPLAASATTSMSDVRSSRRR